MTTKMETFLVITGPPTVISLFDGGGGNSDITFGGSGDITFATTPEIFKKIVTVIFKKVVVVQTEGESLLRLV